MVIDDESRESTQTVNYWASRLFKIVMSKRVIPEPFYFIACNRTGAEKTILFLGSSVIM